MKNTGPKVNFKAYKNGHFLRLVIGEFDLKDMKGRVLYHRGPCPFCCKFKPEARFFAVEMSKGSWYCHKCQKQGDPLDLWAALRGCSVRQAAEELSQKDRSPVPYLPVFPASHYAAKDSEKKQTPGLALGNGNMTDERPESKPVPSEFHQGTIFTEFGGS